MRKALFSWSWRFVGIGLLAPLPLIGVGATPSITATPELSLSLSGVEDDSLEQGEPLHVTVRLESSGEGLGSVELSPSAGTWVDAIAVEMFAAGKNTVVLRASPVGVPNSPRATIDRGRVAGGAWIFPASSMQGLARGDYLVRARLSIKSGAGWSGEALSDEVPLSVVGVSTAPERVSARTLMRAQIAFGAKAYEESARLLDGVLVKTPDDVELLCLRADVALQGGNPIAAMICVNRAARSLAPKTPGPPPLVLHDIQSRVLAARLAPTAPATQPPKWTWPPVSVMMLPEKEATALLARAAGAPAPGESPKAATHLASTPTQAANSVVANAPMPAPPGIAAVPSRPLASSIGNLVPAAELTEAKILADIAGQWATSARAGSEYGRTQYSAARATGAPNVPIAGNSPDAWCPAVRNVGMDWLEVTFANPVRAVEIRARQNDAAGAIAKVEAIEPDGTAHTWWEGKDPYAAPAVRQIAWFAVRVPKTAYPVARIKFTLNLASGPGYKQIDAVQLVAAP